MESRSLRMLPIDPVRVKTLLIGWRGSRPRRSVCRFGCPSFRPASDSPVSRYGVTRGQRESTAAMVATRQRMMYARGMGQLTKAIAAAVKASDETPYAIAKGAGVARSQLSRLMSGERGLNTDTIERLADYLGLRITIEPKGKTTKGR